MKQQILMTACFLTICLFSRSVFSYTEVYENETQPNYMKYVIEFARILNQEQDRHDVSFKIGSTPVADSCITFIDENQFLGSAGFNIFKAMSEEGATLFPRLTQGGNISRYCRRYPAMNQNQKALVWVLLMTTVAHFESSCAITAKAKGPNGVANGFFQLHKGSEQNYDNKMGICVKNASMSEKLSSRCALAMLEYQYERTNGNLFSSDSYWDVLRPRGRAQRADDIQRALSRSTLCNPVVM